MSNNFYNDNPDLQYYVDKGIDWNALVSFVEDDLGSPDGSKPLMMPSISIARS